MSPTAAEGRARRWSIRKRDGRASGPAGGNARPSEGGEARPSSAPGPVDDLRGHAVRVAIFPRPVESHGTYIRSLSKLERIFSNFKIVF